MAYLGAGLDAVNETLSTINMVCDTMTGDGSTTTKVLSSPKSPGSVNNVSVYYDGVAQKPTTDYTLSNLTITFTTAPENNVNVVILSYANEFANILSDKTVYSSSIEDGAITNDLISGISSSKLTGALPALDGSALTGVTPIDPVLLNEAGNPTVSSMTATGNGVGTLWVNSTTGNMFVCTDATVGANVWTNIGQGSGNVYPAPTGGTITTDGDYKVHTFNTSGVFTILDISKIIGSTVEYLVIAGGGGGSNDNAGGGGGGAGAYRTGTGFTVSQQNYTITVGGGGSDGGGGSAALGNGVNGQDSVFSTITSTGGGAGARQDTNGFNGGSGGGGGGATSGTTNGGIANGSGTGNNGGTGVDPASGQEAGGGGGGASSVGGNATSGVGGNGGNGLSNDIVETGINVTYAGGGGGGINSPATGPTGSGGSGGGGNGGQRNFSDGVDGAENKGSGGGGGGGSGKVAGSGGSGVVIIRYQFQ